MGGYMWMRTFEVEATCMSERASEYVVKSKYVAQSLRVYTA